MSKQPLTVSDNFKYFKPRSFIVPSLLFTGSNVEEVKEFIGEDNFLNIREVNGKKVLFTYYGAEIPENNWIILNGKHLKYFSLEELLVDFEEFYD